MTYILCIETTSTNCSVALASEVGGFENDFNIAYCQDLLEDNSDSYSHGELLHVYIDRILERNSISPKDLSAIAISKGPGSYTGLRIGVASAKGLCYALNIPLISIDTSTAIALQAPQDKVTIPMIDARRMEVYSTVIDNGKTVDETKAVILEKDTYETYLNNKNTVIIGSGALKFQELLGDLDNVFINTLPTALTMCDLAMAAYKKSDIITDIAYFEPFYLKEFKSS